MKSIQPPSVDPTPSSHRRWWWAAAAAILMSAGILITATGRVKQPVHQGRPLLEWAAELNAPGSTVRANATNAVRTIGVAGLPALRWALGQGDSHFGQAIIRSETTLPQRLWRWLYARFKPFVARQQRAAAAWALHALGSIAEPALPELGVALRDRNSDVAAPAAAAMVAIGPPSVPVLADALNRTTGQSRLIALDAIRQIGPPAKQAVPALLHVLEESSNTDEAAAVARAIAAIGPEAMDPVLDSLEAANADHRLRLRQVVSTMAMTDLRSLVRLSELFPSRSHTVRLEILQVFQEVRTHSRRAALLVVGAMDDPDVEIRNAAANWIRKTFDAASIDRLLPEESIILRKRIRELYPDTGTPKATDPAPAPNRHPDSRPVP
ncbi:MAG: hypothetical protein ACYC23_04060 [Limisphaerales bacterium]